MRRIRLPQRHVYGCIVFSSLNHALSDILTPGEIGYQIGFASLSNDVDRISAALLNPAEWRPSVQKLGFVLQDFTEQSHVKRWKYVIKSLEQLFTNLHQSDLIRRRSRYRIFAINCSAKSFLCISHFSIQIILVGFSKSILT